MADQMDTDRSGQEQGSVAQPGAGPKALAKAYNKFNVPLPEGLASALSTAASEQSVPEERAAKRPRVGDSAELEKDLGAEGPSEKDSSKSKPHVKDIDDKPEADSSDTRDRRVGIAPIKRE